ncbi:Gfo/Idh/MocA family protein [Paenibacillus glycinis]|uniref:Gfo/Idh/MocA family oxidoreductase n=1 Tax=Paenibacillus glycinis TaxID=2697035 RepID=A0ABW9Y0A6_9BACL|nr:Gfo/Idh/MocA family oxidoreductase [Paenibacillus glycinis]NBD28161.1 Gfo/Idh/MocA family oxidoreductase [Paenibacillus glycinis]
METVKIGIIGVGLIGKHHIEQYASIEGVEIAAVCDINEQEARRVAEQYGIPGVYADYREMLRRDDVAAVDVCLHNNLHAVATIAALQAGKHVYCEKPIAGTYRDGEAMASMAKACGKMLHVQLGTLYRDETKAAKTLIDAGRLGRLYHARSTGFRRRGRPFVDGYGTRFFTRKDTASGGALLDMGVYHIAQMLYLLDMPEVKRISGCLYQEMDMDRKRREESAFDVEESAMGFVRFEGGVSMDIIEAWSLHMGGLEGSSIVGSQGGIRLPAYSDIHSKSGFGFHSTIDDMDFDSTLDLAAMRERRRRLNPDEDAYESSAKHWAAALQGRVKLLPTAEIALKTMLISEGMYLSARLDREVTAEEVAEQSPTTIRRES